MGKSDSPWRAIMFVSFIGIDLSCATLGGFWLGRSLDRWLSTAPWLLITGVLFGLAVGLFSVIKLIKPFIGEG